VEDVSDLKQQIDVFLVWRQRKRRNVDDSRAVVGGYLDDCAVLRRLCCHCVLGGRVGGYLDDCAVVVYLEDVLAATSTTVLSLCIWRTLCVAVSLSSMTKSSSDGFSSSLLLQG